MRMPVQDQIMKRSLRGARWNERGVVVALRFASLCLGCVGSSVMGQGIGNEGYTLPELSELFWGLFLLGGFITAGILWIALIRRGSRRQLEAIRCREAAIGEHYRDLFENAHDILFTHELDGQLSSLNRAGEEILGYSRAEATQLKLTQLILPEDRAAYAKVLEQLEAGTERDHVEVTLTAKDGHRVALRLNVRRQSVPGRLPQVQGIAWDITERRQAEEALRESERRLRQALEDRIRIGRDLHDGIIQSIYAVGLSLGECGRVLKENPDDAERRLKQGVTDLNLVIRDVRNFIVGLEPEALKGRKFGAALESVVAGLEGVTSTRFSFEVEPRAAERLNSQQSGHLLQIAREAISNAIRHGGARKALVALREHADGVQLEVRDDGAGFDLTEPNGAGYGLRNIEGRAKELDAQSEVISVPGGGTRVTVNLPLTDLHAER
jgi:PAS domain S-box-containing protein